MEKTKLKLYDKLLQFLSNFNEMGKLHPERDISDISDTNWKFHVASVGLILFVIMDGKMFLLTFLA